MSNKINILAIVKAHARTLHLANSTRPSVADWLMFLVVPAVAAAIMMRLHLRISEGYVNIIVSMLSIFVGLLLNMIVVLFDIIRSERKRLNKVEVLEETLANISFTIVLAVFTICLVLLTQLQVGSPTWQPTIETGRAVTNYFSFAGLVLFMLTLLMVLKRMYGLFMDEVNEARKEATALKKVADEANAALQRNPLA